MLIDYTIMFAVMSAFTKPFYDGWYEMFYDFDSFIRSPYFMISFGLYSLYLNKDCIGGRSIGKRVVGHKIIDININDVASPIQCLIRNITLPA